MRGGEGWIEPDGLFKVRHTFFDAGRHHLMQMVAGAQVRVIGFRIYTSLPFLQISQTVAFREIQSYVNFGSDGLSNFSLNAQHVTDIALIGFSPELRLVLDFTELSGDAHPIPGAPDFTLQGVIDPEVLSHLLE